MDGRSPREEEEMRGKIQRINKERGGGVVIGIQEIGDKVGYGGNQVKLLQDPQEEVRQ